ncbi:hypothetical protein RHSIM_Rhsim04G0175000 [Rhododendron simsii]|uniref:HAUS augmin-like complex subunit 1 n=1 Tax=Rhododendron simsii TaxID=118357 RepID=A0A834H3P3_RHOSS|nr:hypothetical protein RHSIM_Rhsim04G0175000 [Rhododendron simsii]
MADMICETSPSFVEGKTGFNINQIPDVKAWIESIFDTAGKDVPDFEYTPQSISHLHNLAIRSQANPQAALIVANDLHQKAAEYISQAARIREVLENVGLALDTLPPNVVSVSQVLAKVANLLDVRDTELSSFLIAIGDINLRKTKVETKRTRIQRESKILLDHTRKAIVRLTYFKRILQQLEDDVSHSEARMEKWKTNLAVTDAKQQQYLQQHANFKELLNRVGYTPKISHRVLVKMAEQRAGLEKKTTPIVDTLRSYQDLPPDKALAVLAIEDKKCENAAAEKYLEDVLRSALGTT